MQNMGAVSFYGMKGLRDDYNKWKRVVSNDNTVTVVTTVTSYLIGSLQWT